MTELTLSLPTWICIPLGMILWLCVSLLLVGLVQSYLGVRKCWTERFLSEAHMEAFVLYVESQKEPA